MSPLERVVRGLVKYGQKHPAGGCGTFCRLLHKAMAAAEWTKLEGDPETMGLHSKPVMLARQGSPLQAMAVYHGRRWRHADSSEPVCFEPTHYKRLDPSP